MDKKRLTKLSKAYDSLYDCGHECEEILDQLEEQMKKKGYKPVLNERYQKFRFKEVKA